MYPDASHRVHDLEIVRVIRYQAVPDVLGRYRFVLVRQNFPAILGWCNRLIVLGQGEQVRKERCNFGGGCLPGLNFRGGYFFAVCRQVL